MLILLCGWPACGKRTFAEWLEANRGFRIVPTPDDKTATPEAVPAFVSKLRKQHPKWVLNWGPAPLDMVRLEALKAAGFEPWFFMAGTEQRSRLEWLTRERAIDPTARSTPWDRRRDEIHKAARDLRRLFRDRCIETLSSQGIRVAPETLATQLGVDKVEAHAKALR